jgi:hypothetical protein
MLGAATVGAAAGLAAAAVRLHIGLPGHKALFWLTPVILYRLLCGCRGAGTVAALCAAFGALGWGGNIAGDAVGFPLMGLAGMVVDAAAERLQKRPCSRVQIALTVATAGMLANLVCVFKRMLTVAGPGAHLLFGLPDFPFRVVSYALFGLLAGLTAAVLSGGVRIVLGRWRGKSKGCSEEANR